MNYIPVLSIDLINSLESIYPIVLPIPNSNRDEELYKAGQRSVIDFLLQLLKETQQEENYSDILNQSL